MADTKEKKTRKRRDYRKELEKMQFYLDTVIRIKEPDDVDTTGTGDFLKGQLHAYRDLRAYLAEMK